MTSLLWTLLALTTLTALGLAAVTRHGRRRRAGALVSVVGLGLLLMVLGADLLALIWLFLLVPTVWWARLDDDPAGAPSLVGGVLAAGVLATGYLLSQRLVWHGLPADPATPQLADLFAGLAGPDAAVPVAVALTALVVLGSRREGAS